VTASSHGVTEVHAWPAGDIAARDQLMMVVYQERRLLAGLAGGTGVVVEGAVASKPFGGPTMRKHLLGVAILTSASVLVTGCNDGENTVAAPSPLRSLQVIALDRPFLVADVLPTPFCPFVQPFRANFNVIVGVRGGFGVFLHEVQMGFFNGLGTHPRVVIPTPGLMDRFGSTFVPGGGSRAFPFFFDFGCFTGRAGTLVVAVRTRDDRRDDRGSIDSKTIEVEVR
jgi:hypothetical protein